MGSKGGGKGGGRRKRGKGAGNRSTRKRSPQGDDAGADTSPGSTASPSGKSPATNRRKVDDVDPLTMEVEALDDGTEAAAAKAAEEAAQRLEAESQNVTPDETEKNAKAKEPTPPTDQEQDGQDSAEDEETPRSPPQRQKPFANSRERKPHHAMPRSYAMTRPSGEYQGARRMANQGGHGAYVATGHHPLPSSLRMGSVWIRAPSAGDGASRPVRQTRSGGMAEFYVRPI